MDLKLPKESYVNKFIPKNKFFGKTVLSTKIKDEFTEKIQKITWKYKLSPETLSISKTANVEEIQVFEIELKEKIIPQNVLKVIDKLIPYPILYIFVFWEDTAFWITLKDDINRYYFSEWNEEIDFDFHWINLEIVYENTIKKFIRQVNVENNNFLDIIWKDKRVSILKSEIQALKNKIKSEKQFNKKVILNNNLQLKTKELEILTNNL